MRGHEIINIPFYLNTKDYPLFYVEYFNPHLADPLENIYHVLLIKLCQRLDCKTSINILLLKVTAQNISKSFSA